MRAVWECYCAGCSLLFCGLLVTSCKLPRNSNALVYVSYEVQQAHFDYRYAPLRLTNYIFPRTLILPPSSGKTI